jgi:hypothetical protein
MVNRLYGLLYVNTITIVLPDFKLNNQINRYQNTDWFKITGDDLYQSQVSIFQYYAKEKKCGKLGLHIILPNLMLTLLFW